MSINCICRDFVLYLCKFNFFRHKEDNRANRRKVSVIRKGALTVINSESIKVGDILYLTEDQEVPCDVIVLSSSQEQVGVGCEHTYQLSLA